MNDPVLIGWAGVAATVAVWLLSTILRPRRRLKVWFSGTNFVAAPNDELGLAVTFQGEPIPEPVHVVQVRFQCGGNRDIVIEGAEEFVRIESGEGIDIITARYRRTSETQLKVLESTARTQKFKFDLLKRPEVIEVDLYVRSKKKIEHATLPRLFKTTVHIRDVKKVMLAARRYEIWGATLGAIAVGTLYLITSIMPMFSPISADRVLVNAAGEMVFAADVRGDEIEVCSTNDDVWDAASCGWKPASEFATYAAPPEATPARYSNRLGLVSRIGLVVLLFGLLLLLAFGGELGRFLIRQGDKLRGKE